jgi:ankyrin repeat protein
MMNLSLQADIDAFVKSVYDGTITPGAVTDAVVTRGIPVNQKAMVSYTALELAVDRDRRELIVALLAVGADANVKTILGQTLVWRCARWSTADILQLLVDAGGSVNEPMNLGETPLIALVRNNVGDAAARLGVLLACPELDLDAKYNRKTAEEWAVDEGHSKLAAAIAAEVLQAPIGPPTDSKAPTASHHTIPPLAAFTRDNAVLSYHDTLVS